VAIRVDDENIAGSVLNKGNKIGDMLSEEYYNKKKGCKKLFFVSFGRQPPPPSIIASKQNM